MPLMRSFPKGMGHRKIYPHMIKLIRCKDIRVAGISIINSPSWTFYPYDCDRLSIDGIYIHTDQKYGVWADGIDPDSCRDVHHRQQHHRDGRRRALCSIRPRGRGPAQALRKHHGHQLPPVFLFQRHQILRRQSGLPCAT